MKDALRQLLFDWLLPAEPVVLDRFEAYCALLLERNRHVNLIGSASPEQVASRHFLDSLAPIKAGILRDEQSASLIDVGSGAGFPGVPLAIFLPNLTVTLLDSNGKRIAFLQEVVNNLELGNIKIHSNRAETASRDPSLRECFDFAVSRAVADMSILCELCIPFIKLGGDFIAYKSRKSAAELNKSAHAIAKLGGIFLPREHYLLPPDNAEFCLVRVQKRSTTPAIYPRTWTKINSSPL